MFEKHLWNVWHSTICTLDKQALYKSSVLKNSSNLPDKHKEQLPVGVLPKGVLKHFLKFTEKTSLPKSAFQQSYRLETLNRQKQPLEIVCKTRCSWKFYKFCWKKSVLKSLLNKVGVLRACNFIKEDSDTGVFLWNL